jgi:hypothetical protein
MVVNNGLNTVCDKYRFLDYCNDAEAKHSK